MLDSLITSKTRVKLLLKFFLNSRSKSYLRNLASEFDESTNAIRLELNRFEEAGMLKSDNSGNKKIYQANTDHPLFDDIHRIILKHVGLDRIIETVIEKLGDIEKVFLTGQFAKGIDNHIIDLIFIGDKVNREFLLKLIEKAEQKIKRKIKYIIYSAGDFEKFRETYKETELLLLWKK